jgi:hypothetical protein
LGLLFLENATKNRHAWSWRFVREGNQKQNKQLMAVPVKPALFSLLFNILNDNLHIPRHLLHLNPNLSCGLKYTGEETTYELAVDLKIYR